MTTQAAPCKVLMLHGFSQNASIFGKRLAALRKSLGPNIELVFVNAPIALRRIDLAGSASEPSLDAVGASEANPDSTDEKDAPRAWWRADRARQTAKGLEDTLIYIREILRKDRFDGVFGFSQGAGFAPLLAALLERPHVYPPFLVDGLPPHPPFKFCISVAGFKAPGELSQKIYSQMYTTPTLLVMGKNDIIVVEERSKMLMEVAENIRVEQHDGGHFVPSKVNWRVFLKGWMENPQGRVPSPSAITMTNAEPEPATRGRRRRSSLKRAANL
ncbi:FSH1-domain-containing protein [Coniophora puteana RWD-64-598 SS2]|uniref:FSH1-domain-containing protein n=1 Tax=Coniophora puteana (strain RWD-64-598) TaxID=741705 RepID=A0A5M3MMY4_CONPW|nr:FSH1-domain-containing protein [Coniophora puteana RWD-64-598 SS2]EIW80538.1 FSH1-domain-containing protein [Coniophora puteana RWD-64-598 SS2]